MDADLTQQLPLGSDQMLWPYSTIADEVDAIESGTFLTAYQKRDIYYNNAARFLRLSDEQMAKHHGR